jgi:hypothetical protein
MLIKISKMDSAMECFFQLNILVDVARIVTQKSKQRWNQIRTRLKIKKIKDFGHSNYRDKGHWRWKKLEQDLNEQLSTCRRVKNKGSTHSKIS